MHLPLLGLRLVGEDPQCVVAVLHDGDFGFDTVSGERADRRHGKRGKAGRLLPRLDQDLLRIDMAEAAEPDARAEQPDGETMRRQGNRIRLA